jgi:hypothetical protein
MMMSISMGMTTVTSCEPIANGSNRFGGLSAVARGTAVFLQQPAARETGV